ncbi:MULTISPECIES: hypothetical protein [unclassified Moorena]|uniref:Uncharacterized protein n=1 Tax=Moorena producens 3L TaxID=489825 RepID=F4Y3D0_9CYAN|nr:MULTISPECIES: hypothetical protein [unclassified Moorena]EGJ28606.1 hypothetical protein LYNGBM3L_73090 [Moorena producens 3L]NEQ05569.1 hypothetical protein [Moorena sp. SIO4E2]NES41872.1 hypothetical protein [Moorena sp. SIO2C4]
MIGYLGYWLLIIVICSLVSIQLSAISYQLSVISYQLMGYQLSAYELLARYLSCLGFFYSDGT